jgi:hypothetical protein
MDVGWMTDVSELESLWRQEFSIIHDIQTGFGARLVSYPMSTGGSFPEVKRPGREGNHSPPTSAEVKKTWVYTSTPP